MHHVSFVIILGILLKDKWNKSSYSVHLHAFMYSECIYGAMTFFITALIALKLLD